jgi:hypothetical protein
MIGKVITGKSFGGCVRYVVQKNDAVILEAAGVRMQQVNQTISDFNLQRKFNPGLGKAVGHIALSWSVNDTAKLNDEVMVDLAKEYLQKMKIQNTQYLIVKHKDKENPHIHIVYNRVNNNGKTISDNFQKQRNVQVAKELTLKYGFYFSPGKGEVNRKQLKGEDRVKYQLFDAIKLASKKVNNVNELIQLLAKQGIQTHLKYKSGTNEIQGISFSKGDYKFKGSEIDRSLSYSKLVQAIEKNHVNPEKSLADQLREVIQQSKPDRQTIQNTEQTIYAKQEPEFGFWGESLSSGLNLLEEMLGNIADDNDGPERKRRKKNQKEESRGTSR